MTLFLNDWAEEYVNRYDWTEDTTSLQQLMDDFAIKEEDLEGVNILVASYTYECYSGSAFVIFEKDGKLYEVNGGHCSCYGLEHQWQPEETSVDELIHRLTEGTFGKKEYWDADIEEYLYQNEFATELLEMLHSLQGVQANES